MRFVLGFQLWPSIAVNLWIQRIFRALIFQLSFQRLANSISWCWLFQQSCDSDTATLLEKLGCNVATVASRFERLSALGQTASSFQILLLNIQKPEMDGYEVAMRIWKLRSLVLPLIIAMIATYDDDVSD
jgi:ethylene receptor